MADIWPCPTEKCPWVIGKFENKQKCLTVSSKELISKNYFQKNTLMWYIKWKTQNFGKVC